MPGKNDLSPAGFYSLKEVAELTGLHPESVLRGIRDRRYRLTPHAKAAWRTARKYFFRVEEVQAFCAELITLRS